jgi:hypothetical protein
MIRSALLTSVVVLSSVAIAPKTMAQTTPPPQSNLPQSVDVPFSGQVTGVCNVGEITPGTLMPNASLNPIMLSSGGVPTGTSASNGMPGKVVVTCNSSASIAISKPVQTGGPVFNPVKSDATVRTPSGLVAGAGSTTPLRLSPNPNPIPLEVGMMVDKGSPLTPGNYNYKVTLTIAP